MYTLILHFSALFPPLLAHVGKKNMKKYIDNIQILLQASKADG